MDLLTISPDQLPEQDVRKLLNTNPTEQIRASLMRNEVIYSVKRYKVMHYCAKLSNHITVTIML